MRRRPNSRSPAISDMRRRRGVAGHGRFAMSDAPEDNEIIDPDDAEYGADSIKVLRGLDASELL